MKGSQWNFGFVLLDSSRLSPAARVEGIGRAFAQRGRSAPALAQVQTGETTAPLTRIFTIVRG
jgi:hypothetical protein